MNFIDELTSENYKVNYEIKYPSINNGELEIYYFHQGKKIKVFSKKSSGNMLNTENIKSTIRKIKNYLL